MQSLQSFVSILIFVVLAFDVCESGDCNNPLKSITVGQSGKTDFKTIQSAIDSVPAGNSQWIHIQISSGVYKEHVLIPKNKPCIYLEGAGSQSTSIEWGSHENATFDIKGSNTVAKGITFTNTLNSPVLSNAIAVTQAKAAKIHADKCAFYSCSFLGVQDTINDDDGRHYYKNCYIQGSTDFIYGNGQSLFEASTIYFSNGKSSLHQDGVITAQYRNSPNDPSGFVFKNCNISGTGYKTELGRPMRPYARVIIAYSYLSDVVRPEGWSQFKYVGQEENLTFVEEGCTGPGADKSKRVKWMKSMSGPELDKFLSLSFIVQEGWISKLPASVFH
ncbi:probable pectinesterase 29 isoform X2 [Lathyrus oleraceus]|uniref:probable pectinesterase 29 isoform X2 n=1 Tax=Pisum sativum TaxID=3888 RepID=UPI0021D056B5|nr:probable pectinesterase 29 isoform X2 [Pisum sativum]